MKKLVRDNIPSIIEKNGETPNFYIANEQEYNQKLKEKLQEEVNEYLVDENEEELADVLEVIDAICNVKKFSKTSIQKIKMTKRKERGVFKKKIILEM